MDFIAMLLRNISLFLDQIIYPFIGTIYNLLTDIANTTIFSKDIFLAFSEKVYALLGVFMLFKLSFSILTYIINPDEFSDKNKGFTKLITNVIYTLIILVAIPFVFDKAMELQTIILRDNVIGKIFTTTATSNNSYLDAGDKMAFETLNAFYHLDSDGRSSCEDIDLSEGITDACLQQAFADSNKHTDFRNRIDTSYRSGKVNMLLDFGLVNAKGTDGEYSMKYTAFISTVAGVIIVLLLISFCFDIAVRSVKLGFLRMLAPVPIISRLDPKKGKDTFDKWLKSCISTYLDLFIRLVSISFAVFVIGLVTSEGGFYTVYSPSNDLEIVETGEQKYIELAMNLPDSVDEELALNVLSIDFDEEFAVQRKFDGATTGSTKEINGLVKVFIIMGALLFAKQLPKLIEEITGFKSEGKFSLNPMKKLKEVPGIEKTTTTIGGTVAGAVAGQRVGNAALGAALGFANGWKNSTLMGNGKGGFMTGANGAYKQLMGKDFLNFQFKPGGEKAVAEIKEPLKAAYAIRTELEKQLNVISSQTANLAQQLIGNGVDINGDLAAQSSNASNAINQLSSAIAAKNTQIQSTTDQTELANLNNELRNLQTSLKKQQAIVSDINNYQSFSEQEIKVRTAVADINKDIDDLSTEKKQRQNFYGVDPSPAGDVRKSIDKVNKGINEYLK